MTHPPPARAPARGPLYRFVMPIELKLSMSRRIFITWVIILGGQTDKLADLFGIFCERIITVDRCIFIRPKSKCLAQRHDSIRFGKQFLAFRRTQFRSE